MDSDSQRNCEPGPGFLLLIGYVADRPRIPEAEREPLSAILERESGRSSLAVRKIGRPRSWKGKAA